MPNDFYKRTAKNVASIQVGNIPIEKLQRRAVGRSATKGASNSIAIKATKEDIMEAAKQTARDMVHRNIKPIFQALIDKAVMGDVPATKELLDRAWGKSKETVDINQNVVFSLRALSKKADELEALEMSRGADGVYQPNND